ncbi:putative histidine phosphatase [Cladophialophora carrionii]|uniref:Putative histidine phosphatase n=1 Tax=Cladophialophora carrionii TaxID=86049 RepID=A0A1C1CDP3_9EURO|nr:putative histidine phosphatase [Cladophialophora carrionii]
MSAVADRPSGQLHLLFVRHGETQDNIDKILQGLRDTSLTEKGLREGEALAKKLQNQRIDAVYHSPLNRIVQTIRPILADRSDTLVHADADLTGQSLGQLEGGSYDTIDMSNPRSADGQPGVELFDDFVRRLKKVFAVIVGTESRHVGEQDRTVLIATHGVGITSLFKALEASPSCEGFNPKLAVRGPEAYEVRWTDSDDVAKIVVPRPRDLPVKDGSLDWSALSGQPFVIERWGKREKAL